MLSLLHVAVAGFESSYVRLCGIKHHIRDTGDVEPNGPVAILLHGFAGSTESWDLVGSRLAAGGYRAIAIDRVGFGKTERPPVPTLPVPPPLPFGEQLADVLESLQGDAAESPPQGGGGLTLPDPRTALAIGLRTPSAGAVRLPWSISAKAKGDNPYSARFATTKALRALLRERVGAAAAASGLTRDVYLVGHSAGGGIAIRALAECAAERAVTDATSPLPPGTALAGVALIAPAVLDAREDPDAFEADDEEDGDAAAAASQEEAEEAEKEGIATEAPGMLDGLPLPPALKRRADLELRIAAFRGILSLPNAFGLQTARRIYVHSLQGLPPWPLPCISGLCHASLTDQRSRPVCSLRPDATSRRRCACRCTRACVRRPLRRVSRSLPTSTPRPCATFPKRGMRRYSKSTAQTFCRRRRRHRPRAAGGGATRRRCAGGRSSPRPRRPRRSCAAGRRACS